jgi:Peptidase family M20/M25/M40/Peptidase dimerisation domain
MNGLQTTNAWGNRIGTRPVRRGVKLPEPLTSGVDQAILPARHSTQREQQAADFSKELTVGVPDLQEGFASNNVAASEGVNKEGQRSRRSRTGVRFWLLNKWQGQVLKVGESTFEAQLYDPAQPNSVDHGEFLISDLPDDGRALLRPGATFYWMIGYRDEGTRQRRRESIVWMRRSGKLGVEKFQAALESVNRTWAAFEQTAEAHIEQGEMLESGGLKIGVVTSIVGIWQYRITFSGEQNHAGTTRMEVRKDAGLALARFCVAIDDRFPGLCGPRTVWTTGCITLDPGAPSIIPGRAEMLFQIRDDDPEVIDRLEDLLRSMAAEVSAQGRCSVAVERLRTGAPAMMDAAFQHAIEAASAAFAGGKSVRMPSGAGHDAQVLATIMPAGMLFVPSIGGISHHWSEDTGDADIVTGAEVFVEACRRLLAE